MYDSITSSSFPCASSMNSMASRGSAAAVLFGNPVCCGTYLRARIGDRHRQPANAHYGQVDHVVAQIGDLFQRCVLGCKNLSDSPHFVRRTLKHMLQAHVARAQRYRLRNALGDDGALDAAQSRE
jgi:hypothetical protein